MKKKPKIFLITFLSAVALIILFIILNRYNLLPKRTYTAEDFGIKRIIATTDFNSNSVDDYTDIMLGARADAENHPKYDGAYCQNGYPPDNIGVCSDVIWRAFKNAGYNLRAMIDSDIQARPEAYTNITKPDSNIDFRRVKNLRVFFEKYAVSLTTDTSEIAEWQPGDIAIFNNDKHIGIVSDKRNSDGVPYIIHNGGQPKREEDYLNRSTVTGHWRFDAEKINPEILIEWKD